MCGRIACTLSPNDLCYATAFKKTGSNIYSIPAMDPTMKDIAPCYNIPPTMTVPVLVSTRSNHFQKYKPSERVLVGMRFGIIPPFNFASQGDKSYALETHLCRMERMHLSRLYNPIFEDGQRCVIPCTGYYEWQSTEANFGKQPYFFFNVQNDAEDLVNTTGKFHPEHGWGGIKLLYLAGLYNVTKDSVGKPMYSFTILTKQTTLEWSHIHYRMPAVLQSSDDVQVWLSNTWRRMDALDSIVSPSWILDAHPVSTFVNSTRNNSPKCLEKIDLELVRKKSPRELWPSPQKSGSGTGGRQNSISIKKWLEKQSTALPLNETEGSKQKKDEDKATKKENESASSAKKKRTLLDDWLNTTEKKPKMQ